MVIATVGKLDRLANAAMAIARGDPRATIIAPVYMSSTPPPKQPPQPDKPEPEPDPVKPDPTKL
jgi:HAMP domain-containing protein